MKDLFAKLQTIFTAITFAEANEHATARLILRDGQKKTRPIEKTTATGCGKTAAARA